MKRSFVALELVGIYIAPAALLVVFVEGLLVLYGAAVLFHLATPSYAGAASFILAGLFEQPLVIPGVALEIVASIIVTRAAFQNQAWSHWGAVVLIAASTPAPILAAYEFNELAIWAFVLAYCAGCAAFVVAMTFAFLRYGEWGGTAQEIST